MNQADPKLDPDYYPRLKYKDTWYAIVPEIVNRDNQPRGLSRCTGCAFQYKRDDDHYGACSIVGLDDAPDKRMGYECEGIENEHDEDSRAAPYIFVDITKWDEHLAERVAHRMRKAA